MIVNIRFKSMGLFLCAAMLILFGTNPVSHADSINSLPFVGLSMTLDFPKEEIEQWAEQNGWEVAHRQVKSLTYREVEAVGDWERVVAILYTPEVTWVEARYWADYHQMRTKEAAEERYRTLLIDPSDGVYFFVVFKSPFNHALDGEDITFVLEDDRNRRWEAVVLSNELETSESAAGISYVRAFDVLFPFVLRSIDWKKPTDITLHMMREDRSERAQLTWSIDRI